MDERSDLLFKKKEMWLVIWVVLSFVCAALGNDKKIGAVGAFFASLLLSPLIGFVIVLASDKKIDSSRKNPSRWKELVEQAELEKYKGNIDAAIDRYKEAKFYLEKDFQANQKHTHLRLKYVERIDGLRMIIDKLTMERSKN